jgi:hypothetical protein
MTQNFTSFTALFVLAIACFSCTQGRGGADKKNAQRVLYGAPVPVGSAEVVIVPVKLIDRKDVADAYYADAKDFAQISDDAENLIFHNKKTGANHLLSIANFGKISFQFLETNFASDFSGGRKYILYKAVKNDTNKDGKFDWDDATTLYISEENGKKFLPLTPENTRLIDWVMEFGTPNLYVRYLLDTDGNEVFDLNDGIRIIKINLNEYYKKSKTPEENALIQEKEMKEFDELLLKSR